jgi:hypothetical protein
MLSTATAESAAVRFVLSVPKEELCRVLEVFSFFFKTVPRGFDTDTDPDPEF